MKTPQTDNLNEHSGLMEAIRYFSDPDICLQAVAAAKWPDGPECPKCQAKRLSFLKTRRLWTCLECRKQFSVKVGTIFEDSAIGLDKWLTAMWMIANCKNGVSSYEVARALHVTQRTAWFMLQRIRHAMTSGTITKMSGEIEADETFVGGKVMNMHRRSKRTIQAKNDGNWGKTVVLGLLERESGKVRAAVAPSRRKHHVHPNIIQNVEPGSKLYTDEFNSYDNLPPVYIREFVNHLHTYVQGRVHTNGIENFWSLLKRTLKGTYVSVDPAHLMRYVEEQAFRFNNRKDCDTGRFQTVLGSIAGKRLTWQELICQEAG